MRSPRLLAAAASAGTGPKTVPVIASDDVNAPAATSITGLESGPRHGRSRIRSAQGGWQRAITHVAAGAAVAGRAAPERHGERGAISVENGHAPSSRAAASEPARGGPYGSRTCAR